MNFSNPSHMSVISRVLAAGVVVVLSACAGGNEGERCNPNVPANESECNAGLTCQQPLPCVENYCCPATLSSSSDPHCNGSACAAASQTDASGDATPIDASGD